MVVAEQSAESFTTHYFTASGHFFRIDDLAVEALVRPLRVVVGQVLVEHAAQLPFAGQDEVIEHLGLEGENPALRVGVGVCRRLHPVGVPRNRSSE